ncbi:MBL fold metallo-hydrolase [candidate division BRC1 bacterium HGW-BRC1-1]|jgi:metallo-beta-lactamase family protein|nr:MAG: MBL fold metallo-hydrolase [candidate division BRC1 bacterium HGW-BRC1-1]
MKATFWGAARTVTGSSHLLELNGHKALLDCGLFQGRRQQTRELNLHFVLNPAEIEEVILSHAHIDHSGNLPALSRYGFSGNIYCTNATRDLVEILLRDSGHIQEKDAEFMTRRNLRKGEPPVEPLYTTNDVEQVLPQLKGIDFGQSRSVMGGAAQTKFHIAGHILGAAFVEISYKAENGADRTLVFSGDLGRREMPLLRDPASPPAGDTLILESTYGNRLHPTREDLLHEFSDNLNRVLGRGGKVIIPAFSVGRTQEIVYALNNLWNEGKLPKVPVFVDSPLSTNATQIFRRHLPLLNDNIQEVLKTDSDPFGFDSLTYVRDVQTSKMINTIKTPVIIISASGMAEAGRVLHHLSNNIEDPRNGVMIVGFQAEHTLGRKLVEKLPEVRILGEMHQVRAEIMTANGMSAHGDQADLRRFAADVAKGGKLKRVFLVHGEETAMQTLASVLREDIPNVEIIVPERGQSFDL